MKKELVVLILLIIFLFGCINISEESNVRSVCENAQDGGICNGLNFVFGAGYEGECCESFGKCCE